jgi:hypothetical protein
MDSNRSRRRTGSEGWYIQSALGHSRLRILPLKMLFDRAVISTLETLRFTTRVGSDCPQYSKVGWA